MPPVPRFHVKAVRDKDIPTLLALREELFLAYAADTRRVTEMTRFSKRHLKRALKRREYAACLAYRGTEPIGCVGVTFYRLSPKPRDHCQLRGYISGMYVKRKFRRCGVGTKLLRAIMRIAGRMGAKMVSLHAGTRQGIALYAREGFAKTPEMQKRLG
jgi:GNAT superfamily N-acetyltransferase